MVAFNLAMQLAILMFVGVVIQVKHIMPKDFDVSLTKFIMNIALPALVIKIFSVPFSPDELKNSFVLLLISLTVCFVLFLLGTIFYLFMGKDNTGRLIRLGTMLPNFSFIGIPIIEGLYGSQGLFYLTIFTLPVRVIYYGGSGFLLGSKKESNGFYASVKEFFSPPVIAIVIGLFLYFTGLSLPAPLESAISSLGSSASPLGMILAGMMLGKQTFTEMLRKPRALIMVISRNILSPILIFCLMLLLPVNDMMFKVIVIYSALPCASMISAFAIQYVNDETLWIEASEAIFVTTMLSVITIPIWATFLDKFLA